jgi:hypothetical protein
MKSTLAKTAVVNSRNSGVYVEFSRVEVPMNVKKALYNELEKTCPKNADITDEEIQEMVNEVRYGKRHK